MAIQSLTALATSLGKASSSATDFSSDVDKSNQTFDSVINDYTAMIARNRNLDGSLTELGQRMYEEAMNAIESYYNSPSQYTSQSNSGYDHNQIVIDRTWASLDEGNEVPALAGGTPLVRKAGIAWVDQGERVLTADQNKAYSGAGAPITIGAINNNIYGITDPAGFSRIAGNYIRQEVNQLSSRIRTMN
jgi:hypothetical protein